MRRKVVTRIETETGAVGSSVICYLLRAGAALTTGGASSVSANSTATVRVLHPGALKTSDTVYWLQTDGTVTGSFQVNSTPTYNASGYWEVVLLELAGSDTAIGTTGNLVLQWANSAHYVDWYAGDTGGSATAGVISPSATTGQLKFYVEVPDIDIAVTSGGALSAYFIDVPVERRDFVTPEEFGAVGDGTTDDTAALQAAIDYLGGTASGGTVFLQNATYAVTQIEMRSHVRLVGTSRAASVIKHTGTDTCITRNGDGPIIRYAFENFTLLFNQNNTTVGFDCNRFGIGVFREVTIDMNSSSSGVAVRFGEGTTATAYYNELYSCEVSNGTTRSGTAFQFGVSANTNMLIGCRTNYVGVGVDATGTGVNHVGVIFCSFEQSTTAVSLGGSGGHVIAFNRFENNPTANTGVSIASGSTRNRLFGNYYTGLSTPISDSGTATLRTNDNASSSFDFVAINDGGGMTSNLGMRNFRILMSGSVGDSIGTVAGISVFTATPEAAVTAGIGSLCLDRTNGDVYIKESGVSTTGWSKIATLSGFTMAGDIDLNGNDIAQMSVVTESTAGAATTAPNANTGFLVITGTGTAISKISGCAVGKVLKVMFSNATPNTIVAAATPADDEILTALSPTQYKVYTLVGWNDGSNTRWVVSN